MASRYAHAKILTHTHSLVVSCILSSSLYTCLTTISFILTNYILCHHHHRSLLRIYSLTFPIEIHSVHTHVRTCIFQKEKWGVSLRMYVHTTYTQFYICLSRIFVPTHKGMTENASFRMLNKQNERHKSLRSYQIIKS